MKSIRKTLKMLNPFNGIEEMPTAVYIIKKLLACSLIYMAANILQQVILTGVFFMAGYDPVQGILPSEDVQTTALYYGFAVYILLALLYCKFIEKRSLKSMGLNKKVVDYVYGAGIAAILLILITGICCITGSISYARLDRNVNGTYMIALLGGLIIQGAAEEIMCRGFLFTSLMKKVSVPMAIFWSASVFTFPHLFNLFLSDTKYVIIGIVNLYLISAIFSLLLLWRGNIWISCGLHSIWNFMLYAVMGLTLSGNEKTVEGIICFDAGKSSIINGGSYGIESSIITTFILGITVTILYRIWSKKRGDINGI